MKALGTVAIVAFVLLAAACAPVSPPLDAPVDPQIEPPRAVAEAEDTGTEPAAEESGAVAPTCSGVLTTRDQEGPYYTPGSPARASLLEEGMQGNPIRITGHVFGEDCTPIAGAVVDFWQADASGIYDNAGYRLRGHVVTDGEGRYAVETIEPGPYTGRPPHIHVKVFDADGRELLTTQMYFAQQAGALDGRVAPDLLVDVMEAEQEDVALAPFDFVVQR